MNKEEVPLAFPHKWERDDGSTVIAYGATLRDYFAAKALQAILSNLKSGIRPQDCIEVSEDAYFLADAMLKAREQ